MSRPFPPNPQPPAPTERLDRPGAGNSPYGTFGDYSTYDSYRRSGRDHGSSYEDHSVRTRTRHRDDHPGYASHDDYGYHADQSEDDDFEDYDAYVGGAYTDVDRRWVWIGGMAGAVLLVAVICTMVILGGGDSGSVSATVAPPAQSRPTATAAAPDTSARQAPTATLSPETVTTVTPTAPRTPAPSATAAPAPLPTAAAAPPVATPDPRTITYTVAGNKQLIDLVTVIYTDQQGALQTELNVALPWSKTVTLDPGVQLKSVTATSVGGQLTCAITDPAGTTLVAQTTPSMLATCTQ
ncbi:hypothetical protein JRC04_09155 [Mycolicibacterium sp. S2-37]|uniref:MmpS family transport accessory protein n=1 Tax=Mycolicibacterium sp. S2-37 TaxID=2810297 RepID=UPI001A951C40|nr:MmpS family transport accessory protein [Mycolicibacterium sp. S2-37]MBO0677627.1 hypothetical protein [Mycolicibacterium sp. S2-37]